MEDVKMSLDDSFDDFETVSGEYMLPPGEFAAPKYTITKRENHGNGYHAHVIVLKRGGYVRDAYALTLKEGEIVLYGHNGKSRTDILRHLKGLRKEIKYVHSNTFNPNLEWADPVGDYIKLDGDKK